MMADMDDRGGGFDLVADGRTILSHRVDAPAFAVARGDARVSMVRGNFRHDDAPTDVRMPRFVVAAPAETDGTATLYLADSPDGPPLLALDADAGTARLAVRALAGHDRIRIDWRMDADESVWGGGEQMSHLRLNGRVFPMWTSEPGVGREPGTPLTDRMNADGSFAGGDYWTTNYPQPTLIFARGHAITLDESSYSVLDLTQPGAARMTVWQAQAAFSVALGQTPADGVRALVFPAAAPPLVQPPLPEWATAGAIVGLKAGLASFDRLDAIIAAGADVAALWCEDWVGVRDTSFGRRLFWDWQWNPVRYPDLPARIAALRARGIRFLGYVNPYLAADGPLFADAATQGFFARRLDSDAPYLVDFGEFDAGVVDFTNPAAADWFAEAVIGQRMIDFGLDGWMADFGEYLPVDLRLHDGDPMLMHNRWPLLWAEVNARAVASRGRTGDILWFMRAGFTGVQRHCPLLWAGDQSVDFSRHDGIGTVITAALSAGLVGNAYSHSDVGGYTSLHGNVRTAELLHRWFELGAFTPVMRTHEGNRPADNLQIDSTPALLADFARWSRVHAALAPWVRQLCHEAGTSGMPVQRALFLHYPDERETHAIQDQYLYGADLLVAPVISAHAGERRVYLPGGATARWRHLWRGDDWPGGWHDVPAPLGQPPAFYRPESRFAGLFQSLNSVRTAA